MWWNPRDWSQTDWGLKPLPAASWVCNFGQTSVRNRRATVVTCQSCGHSDADRGPSPPPPPAPSTPDPSGRSRHACVPSFHFHYWVTETGQIHHFQYTLLWIWIDAWSCMTTRTRQNISISPQILTYSCTSAPTPTLTPPLLCFLSLSFFLFLNVT